MINGIITKRESSGQPEGNAHTVYKYLKKKLQYLKVFCILVGPLLF